MVQSNVRSAVGALLVLIALLASGYALAPGASPLRVGVLFARTRSMAASEEPLVAATLLAVQEINARGGVLGRPLEPVVADGRSDAPTFGAQAAQLILRDDVRVIFGCWTAACRRTVVDMVERYDSLLVYPLNYEGLEESPNAVYTGATPNQQIAPTLRWAATQFGKRWMLVGSDELFSHIANALIREQAAALGAQVVGEAYLVPRGTNGAQVADSARAARPDLIINTTRADENVTLLRALRAVNLLTDGAPLLSFTLTEDAAQRLGGELASGSYIAWADQPDLALHRQFGQAFGRAYGAARATSAPMEAAYAGVYAWAQAAARAGTDDAAAVRAALGADALAPLRTARVGRVQAGGRVTTVWQAAAPVRAVAYPPPRTRAAWERLREQLFRRWRGHWERPPPQQGVRGQGSGVRGQGSASTLLYCSSLFPVPCFLFPVPCSLFPVPCSL